MKEYESRQWKLKKEKYEIEREARRPVYEKLIAVLIADPLGWEMMVEKATHKSIDPSLPTAPHITRIKE